MATITELKESLLARLEEVHGTDFAAYNVQPYNLQLGNTGAPTISGDDGCRIESPRPLDIGTTGRWNINALSWTLLIGKVVPLDRTRTLQEWSSINAELYGRIQRTITEWCLCQAPNVGQGSPKPGQGFFQPKADTRTGRSDAVKMYQTMVWSIENLNVEIG